MVALVLALAGCAATDTAPEAGDVQEGTSVEQDAEEPVQSEASIEVTEVQDAEAADAASCLAPSSAFMEYFAPEFIEDARYVEVDDAFADGMDWYLIAARIAAPGASEGAIGAWVTTIDPSAVDTADFVGAVHSANETAKEASVYSGPPEISDRFADSDELQRLTDCIESR